MAQCALLSSIISDLVPLWWWWGWSAWTFELIILWRSVPVNIQFLTWKSSNRSVNVRILLDHKSERIIFLKDKPHTAPYFQWYSLDFYKEIIYYWFVSEWAKPNGAVWPFPHRADLEFPLRTEFTEGRRERAGTAQLIRSFPSHLFSLSERKENK